MRVVLATGNPGKLQELQALLAPLGIEVVPQSQFTRRGRRRNRPHLRRERDPQGAARRAASRLPAIADDSGLEVDALHGAPGIYSARYAGEHASDDDNLRQAARARCADVPARGTHARAIAARSCTCAGITIRRR